MKERFPKTLTVKVSEELFQDLRIIRRLEDRSDFLRDVIERAVKDRLAQYRKQGKL